MRGQAIGTLFKDAVDEWLHDNVQRLGAALAYYTIFSLAPLLIIAIAISSVLFGQEAAQGHIFNQIQSLIGEDGARAIQTMVENARNRPHSGRLATVIGIIMLIVGATGLFAQLQESLNTIWGVVTKPGRGLLGVIRDRFLSFMLVLGSGFLLLVSLLLSAGLAAMGKFFQHLLPVPAGVLETVNFSLGKSLIGIYLGQTGIASAYGAAGSLVIILIWVYYQIFLFGAELTYVYANRYGTRIVPSENAMCVNKPASESSRPQSA